MKTETVYRRGQRCLVSEHRLYEAVPPTSEREVWHILRTDPRYEARALTGLAGIGLITYCPMVQRTVTQNRKVVFSGQRALIPGYVFVAFDRRIPQIGVEATTGVIGFLRDAATNNRIIVPDSVMLALSRPVEAFRAIPATGARVKLRSGPMAGFLASIERAGPDLICVVLDTLGWKVSTSLDEVEILMA